MKIEEIIKSAKEIYPRSVQYRGRFTEEETLEIEKRCDIYHPSVYMDGTVLYLIRYRMGAESEGI